MSHQLWQDVTLRSASYSRTCCRSSFLSPAPPIKARIARGVSRFPPPRSRLKLGASGSGLAQAPTPRVSLYAPGMQTNEPDLPTVGDFLPGYEASAWYGIAAPKNTSSEIVVKLNMEMNAGLVDAGGRAPRHVVCGART